MPIQIQIIDSELAGYSVQAKEEAKTAVESYVRDLLKEVKDIEQIRRPSSGVVPDVSVGMVSDARITLRLRTVGGESPGWRFKIIRFLASAFPFVVGLMWDSSAVAGPTGKLIYLFAVIVAIILSMLSVLKDN